jgi:hypothetical protein
MTATELTHCALKLANYLYQAGLASVPLTNVLIDGFNKSPDANASFVAEASPSTEHLLLMFAYRLLNENI